MEGDNVNTLNFVFPFKNFFEDVVSCDFSVFNNATQLEFLHSVSNWHQFDFLVPDQAIETYGIENFLGQNFQILFLFVNFNVEDNNGFSNNRFFLRFSGGFSGFLLLQLLLCFLVFFSLVTKKVHIFIFSGGSLKLFWFRDFTLAAGLAASAALNACMAAGVKLQSVQ